VTERCKALCKESEKYLKRLRSIRAALISPATKALRCGRCSGVPSCSFRVCAHLNHSQSQEPPLPLATGVVQKAQGVPLARFPDVSRCDLVTSQETPPLTPWGSSTLSLAIESQCLLGHSFTKGESLPVSCFRLLLYAVEMGNSKGLLCGGCSSLALGLRKTALCKCSFHRAVPFSVAWVVTLPLMSLQAPILNRNPVCE